ncbi:MAG: 50S ribosomal protein L11 methyltransferase [Candidatus Poribacteria bacterium]
MRIDVDALSEAEDIISYLFLEMGSGGVQIEDIKSGKIRVSAYFPMDDDVGERVFSLRRSLDDIIKQNPNIGDPKISLKRVEDSEWTESWRSFFKPIPIGKRTIVYQSWENIDEFPSRDIRIQIDPGMAFGTGNHATTTLSLELLEKTINSGEKAIDLGTGSGILAISAIKLGADNVTAIDIDEKSVEVAKENANINGVGDKIKVICGNLLTVVNDKYDVIICNILTKIILPLIPSIKDYLNPDGSLILSGIMDSEAVQIEDKLSEEKFTILEKIQKDEWVAYLVSNC